MKVTVVPVGEPDVALWCDHCLKPSAIGTLLAFVSGSKHAPPFTYYVRCADCGGAA